MSYYESLGMEWDRQWREPRDRHVQKALPLLTCPTHGTYRPHAIHLQECPDCINPHGDDRYTLFPQPPKKD